MNDIWPIKRRVQSDKVRVSFCSSCKYSLTGLQPNASGWVTCPECGNSQKKVYAAPLPSAWRTLADSLALPVGLCILVIVAVLVGVNPLYALPFASLAWILAIGSPLILAIQLMRRHRKHPGMSRVFFITLFGGWVLGVLLVFGLVVLAMATASVRNP